MGGGCVANEWELGFGHIKFEVSVRPPSKAAEQAVIDSNLEPRGYRARDMKKGITSTMTFRAMRSDEIRKDNSKAHLQSVLTNLK